MTRSEPSTKPFQLAIVCSTDTAQAEHIADTCTTIVPDGARELVDVFKDAGVKTSDLRAKTLLVANGDIRDALRVYAMLVGYSGRYLDAATNDGVVASAIKHRAQKLPDAGKADVRKELVTVSAVPGDSDYVFQNDTLVHLTEQELSDLRSAKRVEFKVDVDATGYATFAQFMTLAGVRARKNFDRLPIMVWGDEREDLDELRRTGAEIRKEQTPYKASVAEKRQPTDRQMKLVEGSMYPMEQLLELLGSEKRVTRENGGKTMWQCPRPQSHTHGDATPSMQVQDNKVRCFVDDAEWIDPVRLVMETCAVTPGEAAAMLATGNVAFEPFAARIRKERAQRSGAVPDATRHKPAAPETNGAVAPPPTTSLTVPVGGDAAPGGTAG
jgi:hypothetical protein